MGTQAGQDPGGRSWCWGYGGVLLTGLLSMACWVCILTEPRTIIPEMVPATMGLDPPPLITNWENTLQLISWRHFLNWGSLLSNYSSRCHLSRRVIDASRFPIPCTARLKWIAYTRSLLYTVCTKLIEIRVQCWGDLPFRTEQFVWPLLSWE